MQARLVANRDFTVGMKNPNESTHYPGLNSNIYDRSCVDGKPTTTQTTKRKRKLHVIHISRERAKSERECEEMARHEGM
jgi:hypothetical protein